MSNIITLEQVEKALGVRFRSKPRKQLIDQTPKSVPDGWIAVPIFPISLFDLREITRELGKRVFWPETGGWYEDEDWFTESVEPGWIVVQKEARAETKSKTYSEQEKCLRPGERFATAQEGIYAMALNFLVNDERLFPDYYIRTSTRSSDGNLVNFGNFDAEGAYVLGWKPGNAVSDVLSLFARSLESLTAEPLALVPTETVQVSVVIGGVEYKGELNRA